MSLISLYHYLLGCGLCPGLHTQCALSGLARRLSVIKWTNPPSGRMKQKVTRYDSMRKHGRKAVLFVMMLLSSRVIFPLCHRFVKVNRVTNRTLFANWCMLEYITYCNMGFRLYVPPLYSMVSLIKA
ncbi:hypothetical protein RchiOBHm_Chr6g0295101 [Rosa chinensis]|uniref:Uncharacterized protein n=1 Tax=Rosa chinensis TaxID=74649 RepID=A0A2P6PX17_ROSCH|nr:hypothetical protein RchiOBHm_Chr6g0295101 [Rosa chinensis]